jgi:hypothetical protein
MKIATILVLGLLVATCGLVLRLNALAWAQPLTSSFGAGNWEATAWAFWQHAWSDLGNISFAAGLLLVAVALHRWLKGSGHGMGEN